MIEEQFVSFDTAKMLKEAGFDEPCSFCYSPCKDIRRKNYKRNSDLVKGFYSRPTQALAARWLREVHHINVYACFDYEKFDERKWFFTREHTMVNDDSAVYCSITNYNSYEEALEAGLQEAIKLIKK